MKSGREKGTIKKNSIKEEHGDWRSKIVGGKQIEKTQQKQLP